MYGLCGHGTCFMCVYCVYARGIWRHALLGNFWILDHLRMFLVHFEGKSEVSGCLDAKFYPSVIQTQLTELTLITVGSAHFLARIRVTWKKLSGGYLHI